MVKTKAMAEAKAKAKAEAEEKLFVRFRFYLRLFVVRVVELLLRNTSQHK